MKRLIAVLLGLALFTGADTVLARNDGHGGGGRSGGGHSGGGHSAGGGQHVGGHPGGHVGGRPVVGVHPGPVRRPGPVFVGRPHHFHRHPVVVGGAVVVAAPLYYPYPYYPPVYAAPAYVEPPVYIEQASEVRYYCPDYRDYYPNVATCPSQWMQVVPDAR